MCQADERPQRRHRPMYLAPSASQWHIPPPPPQPEPQPQPQPQASQRQNVGTHRQRHRNRTPDDQTQSLYWEQHQQHQQQQQQLHDSFRDLSQHHPQHFFANATPPESLSDLGIPLLLEVPATGHNMVVVSPPSSAELSSIEMESYAQSSPSAPYTTRKNNANSSTRQSIVRIDVGRSCKKVVLSLYNGLVDFVLLIAVCLMGCFFYDVEVKVVKSDRRRGRGRGRSGRVVIRTNDERRRGRYQGVATSLLRTPPISASSQLQEDVRLSDPMWEHIV